MIRDENCTLCPMSAGIGPSATCVPAQGGSDDERVDILVVTKYPLSGKGITELQDLFEQAGIQGMNVRYTAVSRCRNWNVESTRTHQKLCADTYLRPEIERLKPKQVLALGGEALYVLTGKRQITKARGSHPGNVYATISPSMLKRNPGQTEGFLADLRAMHRLVTGTGPLTRMPERVYVVRSRGALKRLQDRLATCDGFAYDIESNQFDEFRPDSIMVSVSFTFWDTGDTAPRDVWAIPLGHPASPFVSHWRDIVASLRDWVRKAKRRVAHNGKFDGRWMAQFGAPIPLTFDTMLAAFLLNENRPKGLKELGTSLLGVEPWGIDTKDLMNDPLPKVLKYNALDTWYTAHLYFLLRDQIKKQPRLATLLAKMLVPASNEFVEIEREGIWTDRERLDTNAEISARTLAEIDAQLNEFVPPREEWPAGIKEVNFNPSNFLRWLLFDWYEFPVLQRGKDKEDGSEGAPSVAEGVLQKLEQDYSDMEGVEVIRLLLTRSKWQKYTSAFFGAYQEQIDENDRIHTTFKLTGTVTGRLSSGKADDDKVTSRVQNRGVNLQQVPRDPFVRGIFGAPPGSVFVEADYSQVELRVAAFLAQEPTMLHLYNTGQDIHMATAVNMTGKPESAVTKEERKKAKAVNFGFLYGMGWAKFIETAWNNYGVVVTEAEAQAFRRAFFNQFSKLPEWHNKQRRLVNQFARVESPFGRVRHLPDIRSANRDVQNEAQRQAINSPVQSFASDLAIMSLVSMSRWLRKNGYRAHSVGTVHDAINLEVPIEEVPYVVPRLRYEMENQPLHKYGIHLNVPIVADVKIGTRWGDSIEVPNEVSSSRRALESWLNDYLEGKITK